MATNSFTPPFEVIDHTADWALRVHGQDWVELLANAALGMATLLVDDVNKVSQNEVRRLELDAFDAETLLVDWLTELAYWAEESQLVFHKYSFSEVSETHLKVTARGGVASELQKHIKAVTYHELEIEQTDEGLSATVVFDV
jgi:SHS2 domain-containing protein